MKFIVDNMLGKLAKYLRMMGFSTIYPPPISPSEVISLSEKEKRVILTRSKTLIRDFKPKRFLIIESQDFQEQLIQVLKTFNISPNAGKFFSLCLFCNKATIPISKNELNGLVPDQVIQYAPSFRKCPSCSRIYWKGGHTRRMENKLYKILKLGSIK